ncbi:MAG: hypothetical protein FWG30_06600 [Eubacteriaceae bacterium]|nr:hypothetical protein [Eubacteriaceae bacterium]
MCPKCRSENISYQAIAQAKPKSAAYWLLVGWWWWLAKLALEAILWVFFYVWRFILGLILRKPASVRRAAAAKTYAVCQNCAYTWKVRGKTARL